MRQTWLGWLVLGFGFLWSDLVCYAAGIALAATLDHRLSRPPPPVPARAVRMPCPTEPTPPPSGE